jgi:hypothetical protein
VNGSRVAVHEHETTLFEKFQRLRR